MRRNVLVAIALVGSASLSGAQGGYDARQGKQQRPNIEPRADALLRKMSADLASLQSFSFDAKHVTEVVTKDGQKLDDLAESNLVVQRPNKLRSDRIGPVADAALFYDGRTITIFGKRANVFATAQAPDNLDAAIDFARDKLGLEAPAADLLSSNTYAALTEDVVSGRYIDIQPVGNRMCHHLAFRGNETDWQIWIEDGPRALPCRYSIVSKRVTGEPEYSVELSDWQLGVQPSAQLFAFQPPPGAAKIDFLVVAEARQQRETGQTL